MQSTDSSEGLTTAEDLVNNINAKLSEKGGEVDFEATLEEVKTIRDGVRESIPNLAADKSNPNMTPLESTTVAWAFATGDDETMSAGYMGQLDRDAVGTQDGINAQFAVATWVVWTLITVALYCGYNNLVAVTEGRDMWGNKIYEDEEWEFCWKVKKGKRTVTSRGSEIKGYDYYSYDDLEQMLEEIEPYVQFNNYNPPSGETVSLPSKPNGGDSHISIASSITAFDGYNLWWTPLKNQNNLKKGDIYFSRGNKYKNKLIAKISSWTHAGMVYDVNRDQSLESLLSGVKIYNPRSDWEPAISWADKASMTSMFCFKLVYNTFLQINVDLDSDRTTFSSAAAFW